MNMIYRETLKNGLRIVGETMENYRSVSVGVWIGAGSVFERTPAEAGVSHFIEHMLFKGTYRRSAADIAEEIDSVGGNLNAFTSKECTCFYVKVLEENLPAALDILADLVCNSKRTEGNTNGGDILLAEPTAAFSKALPYILDYISGKGLTAGSVSGTIYD